VDASIPVDASTGVPTPGAPGGGGSATVARRVYVAGGAGAGKTTLGRALADKLGCRHYCWDRGELPAQEQETVASGAWVVEGAHLWAIEPYLQAADVIVWLDVSLARTVPRIVLRHARLSAAGANPHPGLRKLARFVARQPIYAWGPARAPRRPTDWGALTRAQTQRTLAPYGDRLVRLRRPSQVRSWLQQLDFIDA